MLALAMNQLFFLFLHILEPSFRAINNEAQQEHNNIHLWYHYLYILKLSHVLQEASQTQHL